MQLTAKQESMIQGYLRDVAARVDADVSANTTDEGLKQLDQHIRRELEAIGKPVPNDPDVQLILDRLGPPSRQAEILRPARDPHENLLLAANQRIWLGVCAGIASRVDMEPWLVRLLAVILGLVAPPLAIMAYLGAYLEMYYASGRQAGPRPNWWRVAGQAGLAILFAFLLFKGADYAVRGIYYAHDLALKRPVPNLGEWGWYTTRADAYFFWALLFSVPLAALSGLPHAGGWDYSLKRLWQACLAIYAIAICFGIAGILVGIILDVVKEFGGLPLALPTDL